MPPLQDEELWDELRNGHKAALQQIYNQEFEYLFNYGRKVFKRTAIVEDCLHDLFVEIWQRHQSLGPTNSIRRYLSASLRRKIISVLKKESKAQPTESFEQIPFDVELSIDEIIIAQEMNEEQTLKLKRAFDKLTDKQKEILYLRFYQGMDYDQIAEVLDIRYQSLRNAVSRAIKHLRGDLLLVIIALSQHSNLICDAPL